MAFWDEALPTNAEKKTSSFWDGVLPQRVIDLSGLSSVGGVGNTTPALPSPTQPATIPFVKGVAQGFARIPAEFGITAGQAGLSLFDKTKNTELTTRSDAGIPTGSAAWLFGSEPIKGYASQILDFSETIKQSPIAQKYGIDTQATPIAFAGIVGLKTLDFFGGSSKGAKAFITTAKRIPNTAEGIEDMYRVMRGAGFQDDVAKQYAPLFAKETTTKGTEEIVEAAVRLQNSTKLVEPTIASSVAASVPETLKPIATKAAAMTVDDFTAGFEAGLKSQNLTKRETAQNVLREMQTAGYKTPEEFHTAIRAEVPVAAKATPTAAIDPLIAEARKYKSADEFITSHGEPLLHGTSIESADDIAKNGFRINPEGMNRGNGISLTTDREVADIFGENGKTIDAVLAKDAKLVSPQEFIAEKNAIGEKTGFDTATEKATDFFKSQGYDGVDFRKGNGGIPDAIRSEVRIWNPEKLTTKEQLTDLYNQATKGGEIASPSAKSAVAPVKSGAPVDPPRFAKAAKESPEFSDATKAEIELRSKQKVTNKETVEAAKIRVAKSPDEAARFVLEKGEKGAEHTATGIELMRYYDARGNYKAAADIAENLADDLVKAGQYIQAAKLMQRLSPEGVLILAQKKIAKVNQILKAKGKETVKLEDDLANELVSLAKRRDETADPLLKEELGWEISSTLASLERATLGEKISMAQTLAQLLNPKTILFRNPLGNEIFYRFERLNKYVATPIDWAKSKLTGSDRSITFRTAGEQGKYWQNFIRGARAGWKGVIPGSLPSQLDIGRQVFKSKYNPLYWGEKMLGASLRGFDFAAYSRAKNQTMGEMAYLKAINEGKKGAEALEAAKSYVKELDDNLLQIADDYGKYVTFQDDNMLSRGFQAVKRGLNANKAFGLGDLVLKYPRTPGALLMRAIEYSPAGFLRSAYLLAEPFIKGGALNSREIANATSRAITGTAGFTGMGYYLADKGVITGRADDDSDIQALDRQTGEGKYKINISALGRLVASGFKDVETQEGDTMFSYDWAQPVAVSLAIGANINDQLDDEKLQVAGIANAALSSLEGGVNTIAEQPLLQGIKRIFGYGDLFGGLSKIVSGAAASFVPTISNQLNQWIDNTRRNAYDPNVLIESMNYAKAKIPGFAQTVNPMVTTFGETAEVYQGNSNNFFNVFFNPGFVSQYATTPESKLVLDVIESTGSTTVAPRIAPKEVDGVPLTADEYESWQRSIGENIGEAFTAFAESEAFMSLPDKRKASMMEAALTEVGKIAQDELKGTSEAPAVKWQDRLLYQEVQYMARTGQEDKAIETVNSLSDEEYERYKSVRTGERQRNTTEMKKLLNVNPVDAVQFVRSQDPAEADRLIGVLTEEEYALYEQGKQPSFTEE